MFGDYEFLCPMYGLSGANGKYPCLWCKIKLDQLEIPLATRGKCTARTLDNLTEDHNVFVNRYHGNIKKAKFALNVINPRFFDVPITHVCIPGLHVGMGIVVKLVKVLRDLCNGSRF